MQDEQFMQGWNVAHSRFSADVDRGLGRLVDRFSRRQNAAKRMRNPYGIPTEVDRHVTLSPAAKASLRGLAASVITAALWVVVIALATPAPGLAASPMAPVAAAECLAHPLVA
jgi:hypothetical protein